MLLPAFIIPFITVALAKKPTVTNEVTGVSYEGVESNGVEEFLAIRYGHDTSGEARFKPPQAYSPPAGIAVDASVAGPACPQPKIPLRGDPYTIVNNMSEDCLTLRIARPATHVKASKLPVMVWIHGGGHAVGNIYDSSYNPVGLVHNAVAGGTPVIYVAMAYRLNIFGNAVSQSLIDDKSANLGLRDQRLALQWIKYNIAAFGGDPNSITLFGEETGATDIGLHMVAFGGTKEPLFNRAIAQSGSVLSNWGPHGVTSRQNFAAAAFKIGCVSGSPELWYTLNCMRQFTMEQVLEVAFGVAYGVEPVNGFHVFSPVIDGDFIPDGPISLLKEGRTQTGVDYMTGWVMDEATTEVPPNIAITMQAAGWLSERYPQLELPVALQIVYLYLSGDFAARSVCPEAVSTAWCATSRALRDIEVTCPALQQAKLMADLDQASGNFYVYELNQSSFTPALDTYGKSYLGVVHFSDVPYVFNELDTAYGINSTEDKALAKRISADWAAFASSGQPNASHRWPRMATEDSKDTATALPQVDLQVLGGPNGEPRTMTFSERSRCEFIQGLFENSARY